MQQALQTERGTSREEGGLYLGWVVYYIKNALPNMDTFVLL